MLINLNSMPHHGCHAGQRDNEMRMLCHFLTHFLSFWDGGNLSSGEDPLAGDQNDHDMDSIAGVLKLYFRGLEQPLFPKDIFHDLIACVSKYYTPRMAARYLEISITLHPHKLFRKVFLSLFLPESSISLSLLFYP